MSTEPRFRYIDREKSWLAFNARVLQEAADEAVPLFERLRFIGIFSNNLDEFFRVRFAAIRRLSMSGVSGEKILGGISAQQLVKDITEIVIKRRIAANRTRKNSSKLLEKMPINRSLSNKGTASSAASCKTLALNASQLFSLSI